MRRIALLFMLLAVTTSLSAKTPSLPHQNENALSVSRYVDVMPEPTNAQRNPMNLVLPHISFKHNIKSVGQAVNYLLSDTGYKLTSHHPDSRVLKLFRLSLPKIHRNMGPLTLAQALSVLAGEPWSLSVDPINRLVSFQLPDHFKNPQKHKTVKSVPLPPSSKKVVVAKKASTRKLSKSQIEAAQKQYQRVLESKKRARLDRENKARLVKARASIKKQDRVKKLPKLVAKPNTNTDFEIKWSDLPKELR